MWPVSSVTIEQASATKPRIPTQGTQLTPKRVMSPLKKFNRVVPSSKTPNPSLQKTLELNTEENSPLKSSSATLLEQKTRTPGKKERPDSAPLDREDTQSMSRNKQPVPIDARVIVRSNEVKPNEGIYETKPIIYGVVICIIHLL